MKSSTKDSLKVPRLVARIMSALIVGFFLFMFIGEAIGSAERGNSEPMSMFSIIQLIIFGIGLLGLILAWKWELAGGILSLVLFITLFIVNPEAFVNLMLIFPANAIIFIGIGYQSRK